MLLAKLDDLGQDRALDVRQGNVLLNLLVLSHHVDKLAHLSNLRGRDRGRNNQRRSITVRGDEGIIEMKKRRVLKTSSG